MAKKNKKSTKKYSILTIIILVSLVILALAAGVVIYTNDAFIGPRHVLNYFIEEKTGIDLEELIYGPVELIEIEDDVLEQTEQPDQKESSQSPAEEQASEPEKQSTQKKETQATPAPKKTTKATSTIPSNVEIPSCPKNAITITAKNTKGVLETPEKEDTHQIIEHNGFTLCYREPYEQPEWVAYTLNAAKVKKNVERKDNFRPDPLVLTGSAELADYRNAGYDRGHLCPSADLTYSKATMDESFVLSNMSPQAAQFNRGMWKDLEHEMRVLTEHFDILYIVTGPVLEKSSDEYSSIGENKVSVPEYYYKAILGVKNKKAYMIGFILPNEECKGTIWDYAVSIDEVEKRTGIDFFSKLDDTKENALEKEFEISEWKY